MEGVINMSGLPLEDPDRDARCYLSTRFMDNNIRSQDQDYSLQIVPFMSEGLCASGCVPPSNRELFFYD